LGQCRKMTEIGGEIGGVLYHMLEKNQRKKDLTKAMVRWQFDVGVLQTSKMGDYSKKKRETPY